MITTPLLDKGIPFGGDLAKLMQVALRYAEGARYSEIADELKTSVATVSKAINYAKDKEWIKISIHFPPDVRHSQKIAGCFSHQVRASREPEVCVVPVRKEWHRDLILAAVGERAARCFERVTTRGCSVTIDGGETVAVVLDRIKGDIRDIKLFPIAGGPPDYEVASVFSLMIRMHERFKLSGMEITLFPPPSQERDVTSENRDPSHPAVVRASQASVFLLGVGFVDGDDSNDTVRTILKGLHSSEPLTGDRSVVGVSGYSAFGGEGEDVPSLLDKKVHKVCAERIRGAAKDPSKHVILVASGAKKAKAILGALRGGWASCLVTDSITAESISALVPT